MALEDAVAELSADGQRSLAGEVLPREKAVWSSGSDILFCDKCGIPYRLADSLPTHIAVCNWEVNRRQVLNRASAVSQKIIGTGEVR